MQILQLHCNIQVVYTIGFNNVLLTAYSSFKGRFSLGVFLLADEKTKEKILAERKKS